MRGILPLTGAVILWFLGGWSIWLDYDVATANDFTMWTVPGIHWQIGGAFVIAVGAAILGLIFFTYCRIAQPGVLPQGDPDPGHAHPHSRRLVAGPGRSARGRAAVGGSA